MADIVRTTSFALRAEELGVVHVVRAGRAFLDTWRRIETSRSKLDDVWRLPYGSLTSALVAASGSFVRVVPPSCDGAAEDEVLLVTDRRLDPDTLAVALDAWETAIWPEERPVLADLVEDLTVAPVPMSAMLGEGSSGTAELQVGWAWEVARWRVARALGSCPMAIDAPDKQSVRLAIDTEASLITWHDLKEMRGGRHRAMHRISIEIKSIPGESNLYAHLHSSLSRLVPHWAERPRTAWVWRGDDRLLLRARLRWDRVRKVNVWTERDAEVLERLEKLARPEDHPDLLGDCPIRAPFATTPDGFAIGSGPGQMFHELVAHHARHCLPDAAPLELSSIGRMPRIPRVRKAGPAAVAHAVSGVDRPRPLVVGLFADAEIQHRLASQLSITLGLPFEALKQAPLEAITPVGPIDLMWLSPPGARARLCAPGDPSSLAPWLDEHVLPHLPPSKTPPLAFVQTLDSATRKDVSPDLDPKYRVRHHLARHGVLSQCLAHEPQDRLPPAGKDPRAEATIWDGLRLLGRWPHAAPVAPGTEPTWLIGTYVVKPHRFGKWKNYYVVNMVALRSGGTDALGYSVRTGRWVDLASAAVDFLALADVHRWSEARVRVEQGLRDFLDDQPGDRVVLYLEGQGARSLWSGLSNRGGDALPGLEPERLSIVRVEQRQYEIPRPAGKGAWSALRGCPTPLGATHQVCRVVGGHDPRLAYFVSAPRLLTANRGSIYTRASRFHGLVPRAEGAPVRLSQRRPWQAVGANEIWVVEPGPFAPDLDGLHLLTGSLHRWAPTWEGNLSRPAPLHVACALVKDHPLRHVRGDLGGGDSAARPE